MTEHTYTDETEAHTARRAMVNEGWSVTLIGFDPIRNVYAFGSYR
jgi:hypothetical protein